MMLVFPLSKNMYLIPKRQSLFLTLLHAFHLQGLTLGRKSAILESELP